MKPTTLSAKFAFIAILLIAVQINFAFGKEQWEGKCLVYRSSLSYKYYTCMLYLQYCQYTLRHRHHLHIQKHTPTVFTTTSSTACPYFQSINCCE